MTDSNTTSAASVISAIASLVSALAWPLLVGSVLIAVYRNSDAVATALNRLIGDKGSAKFSLGTSGISFEIAERTANASANAVIESASKSPTGPLSPAQAQQVTSNAQSAAINISSSSLDPSKRLKILWVDDHPENNVDLQYAFQVLGIIVICVDSNDAISESFDVASSFDLVISDMFRDEMGGRRKADGEAGLKTADQIRSMHPNIPVVIYAGDWSANHRNDEFRPPVVKITNYPQEVYSIVIDLAKKKAG